MIFFPSDDTYAYMYKIVHCVYFQSSLSLRLCLQCGLVTPTCTIFNNEVIQNLLISRSPPLCKNPSHLNRDIKNCQH